MKNKILLASAVIVLLLAISTGSLAKEYSVSELWEERGKIGLTNHQKMLDEIRKKPGYKKDVPMVEIDKGLAYYGLLEATFALHATNNKELKETIAYEANGLEYYGLGLNLGGEKPFVIVFMYDSKTGDSAGFQILSLPKGWMTSVSYERGNVLGLFETNSLKNNSMDGFFFVLNNPFESWVFVDNKVVKLEQ